MIKKAFTMMELIIAMAIVAILAAVTIPLAKNKMDKVDRYSYYLAYATMQDIAANIVAQSEYEYDASDLATSSVEDIWNNKQYVAYNQDNNLLAKYSTLFNKGKLSYLRMYAALPGGYQQNDPTPSQDEDCDGASGKKLNGRCYKDYIYYNGETCGEISVNSDLDGKPLKKRPDFCSEPGDGYSKACYWGAPGAVNPGLSTVQPYVPQPTDVWMRPNSSKSEGWYCFKYKDNQGTPPVTRPDDLTETCPAGTVEVGDSCVNCEGISSWDMYKNYMPPCPVDCERFGMTYSASKNTCVMPASATNLCERIKADYNISKSNCTITAAQMTSNIASGFKNVDPHIRLSNGLNIYIASDLVKVDLLADAADVRDRVGYLLYVDVNGNKGKGILYQDVFPFYILMSGKVLPVYNPTGTGGANNVQDLAGNIIYDDYSSGNRVVKASKTNVTYQTGACATKFIESDNYCKSISFDSHCVDSNADCRFIINKPMKFFGR